MQNLLPENGVRGLASRGKKIKLVKLFEEML